MTTGQRIAAKRKELELSQEALGESLGVSRQSIYKWESDASLPEIDKLVALSRLFHVSVGWLLGVEETPEDSAGDTFTESQIKMIEEILSRCQPPAQEELSQGQQAQVDAIVAEKLAVRPRRRRWLYTAAATAAVAVILSDWYLLSRLDRMDSQYSMLSSEINNVAYSVNSQVGSIANQVEIILKAQNSLTADYGVELTSADLANNTVTFAMRVVPKTYVEGMEVLFLADSGGSRTELPGELGADHEFTAQITCALTDSISLSAVFLSGDTRQTQALDAYSNLYSSSLPAVSLSPLFVTSRPDRSQTGLIHLSDVYVAVEAPSYVEVPSYTEAPLNWDASDLSAWERALEPAGIERIQVGLFQNQALLQWMEPCERPCGVEGFEEARFYSLPAADLTAAEGDTICFAALITDEYGREQIVRDISYYIVSDGELVWQFDSYDTYSDPDGWTF